MTYEKSVTKVYNDVVFLVGNRVSLEKDPRVVSDLLDLELEALKKSVVSFDREFSANA